jgi:hypothetical protein
MLGTLGSIAFRGLARYERAKTVPEGYVGGNARFLHVAFSCTSYNEFKASFWRVE